MTEETPPPPAAAAPPPNNPPAYPPPASPPPTGPPPVDPPPAGPPPPVDPPPATAPGADQPWAARFGLVRPRHGRVVAGVCAAIGRATNTDPLIWRVLIGVLSIFGVGIVLYVAGWLLIPAEGDTASPIEALFGRGYSSTSTGLTLGLAVVAVILLGALTDSFVVALIAAVGLVIAALATNPRTRQPVSIPPDPLRPPSDPGASQAATASIPVVQGGYQPPFAPHGPYASAPIQVPQIRVARPKREPSRLGRLIFGLGLVVIGLMAIADLMYDASMPFENYVTAALIVTGLGLIVGAWFGRARGFIILGIVLSLMLPIAADEHDRERFGRPGTVSWVPLTTQEISDSYEHRFGEATLDLSNVDFAGHDVVVQADISFGELRVILPEKVDVVVDTDVSLGDATVFGYNISGAGVDRTENNEGSDGPGGGTLRLNLDVKFGHAEVTR
ncbi:hypothetical protein Rhe02_24620 [Rhizocola hellebori]|uniref:PspC domain-containing protein n=1 Tax=Rhizocola hellebori TaxID=1392758 RepID=A0A8J3Q5U7_9ACTN|nr:PspC domain-containing protein [Rhizocola hellebori]GIH04395.1 hypothetical protein Rhe02_24620 [Rhizocola hellebori]